MDTANIRLAKRLELFAWIISAIVLILVGMMRQVEKIDIGTELTFLPAFHAILNSLAAVCLTIAYFFIRKKNVQMHRRFIYGAISLSVLFLLSYVLYHFTHDETRFGGEGLIRMVYLVLLLTHIALAAISFPFILFTFIRGYTGQYQRHRKMAKWIFPIWLYVTITGPICYLMLRPYY